MMKSISAWAYVATLIRMIIENSTFATHVRSRMYSVLSDFVHEAGIIYDGTRYVKRERS